MGNNPLKVMWSAIEGIWKSAFNVFKESDNNCFKEATSFTGCVIAGGLFF